MDRSAPLGTTAYVKYGKLQLGVLGQDTRPRFPVAGPPQPQLQKPKQPQLQNLKPSEVGTLSFVSVVEVVTSLAYFSSA
jgi:hypothetical protein